MIELKLSKIKCVRAIDYRNTRNNCGEYTARWVQHDKKGFLDNKIHISKNNVPIVMVSLKCKELEEISKVFGIILIFDVEV